MKNFVNIKKKKACHLGKINALCHFLLVLKCGNSAGCGEIWGKCAGVHYFPKLAGENVLKSQYL